MCERERSVRRSHNCAAFNWVVRGDHDHLRVVLKEGGAVSNNNPGKRGGGRK